MAETLTYRLLDLEERLSAQERLSGVLLEEARDAALLASEATELRLLETEDRLARLEAVLSGSTAPREDQPLLQLVPSPQVPEESGSRRPPGAPEDSAAGAEHGAGGGEQNAGEFQGSEARDHQPHLARPGGRLSALPGGRGELSGEAGTAARPPAGARRADTSRQYWS